MEIFLMHNRVEAFDRFHAPRAPRRLLCTSDFKSKVRIKSRDIFSKLTHSFMVQLARDVDDETIFIACPDQAASALDFVLPWARTCLSEIKRHFQVRGDMSLAQTIGGGWASVKNVKESLRWALILRHLGRQLGDENCERKCEVFIGWAHLWNGNKNRSLEIFTAQLEEALSAGDAINWNRCTAALSHAQHNPEFSHDLGCVPLPSEIISKRPEELIDQSIQRRNISKDVIAYANPACESEEDADDALMREWNQLTAV